MTFLYFLWKWPLCKKNSLNLCRAVWQMSRLSWCTWKNRRLLRKRIPQHFCPQSVEHLRHLLWVCSFLLCLDTVELSPHVLWPSSDPRPFSNFSHCVFISWPQVLQVVPLGDCLLVRPNCSSNLCAIRADSNPFHTTDYALVWCLFCLFPIQLKWKCKKDDKTNGGYCQDVLLRLLQKVGVIMIHQHWVIHKKKYKLMCHVLSEDVTYIQYILYWSLFVLLLLPI